MRHINVDPTNRRNWKLTVLTGAFLLILLLVPRMISNLSPHAGASSGTWHEYALKFLLLLVVVQYAAGSLSIAKMLTDLVTGGATAEPENPGVPNAQPDEVSEAADTITEEFALSLELQWARVMADAHRSFTLCPFGLIPLCNLLDREMSDGRFPLRVFVSNQYFPAIVDVIYGVWKSAFRVTKRQSWTQTKEKPYPNLFQFFYKDIEFCVLELSPAEDIVIVGDDVVEGKYFQTIRYKAEHIAEPATST